MSEEWIAIKTGAIRDVLAEGIRPLCDRIQELEAENTRLREEWAQEGIGWLRDKDIDRLMGVEDENKRLRRILRDGPATAQECAEFCKAAREDGDGKPCIDCEQERFVPP